MSAVLSPPAATTPWRQALPALGLLLLAILLLYRDSFGAMVGIWARSDTFAHAFLVPPMVLWLVWRRRDALAPYTPTPQPWVLLPMALVAGVWLLGDMAGANALTQLCVTALLVLAVPAMLGRAVAGQLAFPLVFLFFMVPVGEFLLPLMMEATADFTVAAVSLSGVPVYREGQNFVIPSGSWSVVEACSGVRYLIASFMVGTLFAYLNYSTTWRRVVFIGVSILVPVLANWLRAYIIVMLGHLSGNKIAVGVDHIIYGWVFFGVVILLMFLVGARWSEPELVDKPPAPRAAGRADPSPAGPWLLFLVAAAMLALPPAASWQLAHPAQGAAVVLKLPELAGTSAADGGQALLQPIFPGAAAQTVRVYRVGDAEVTVHLAYFRHQGYGAKLVSSENMLLKSNDKTWNRTASGQGELAVAGKTLSLRSAEIRTLAVVAGKTLRLDVRQLYWVGGHYTANDHWATLLGLWNRLTGQGDDAAVLTFYTEGERNVTTPRLEAFVGSHLPALQAELDRARATR